MRFEKANSADGVKIIIDMKELKECYRLQGAVIFNRLFNINNKGFNGEEMNKDKNGELTILCDYNITSNEWYSFISFLRNGVIKFNMEPSLIGKKKIINGLDKLTKTGVFIKFGPFPYLNDYVERCVSLFKNEQYLRITNPKNQEDDKNNLYHWIIVKNFQQTPPREDIWEVCGKADDNSRFWRKKWIPNNYQS